jgi:hypothetical protein
MANFPDTIYEGRTKENRSGVVYDSTKKKCNYAEDVIFLDNEVTAIESFLKTIFDFETFLFTYDNLSITGQATIATLNVLNDVYFGATAVKIPDSYTPSSSSESVTKGTICWDSDFLYIAVADDTWKRIALDTW